MFRASREADKVGKTLNMSSLLLTTGVTVDVTGTVVVRVTVTEVTVVMIVVVMIVWVAVPLVTTVLDTGPPI